MKILIDRQLLKHAIYCLMGEEIYANSWSEEKRRLVIETYRKLLAALENNPTKTNRHKKHNNRNVWTWSIMDGKTLNNNKITDDDRKWTEKEINKHTERHRVEHININARLRQQKEDIIEILEMLMNYSNCPPLMALKAAKLRESQSQGVLK